MSKEKAAYTLNTVSKMAQEAALLKGYHVPLLLADGDLNALVLSLDELAESHQARAQQLFFIGMMMAQGGQVGVLQQVFFVSEGWMSVAEDGKSIEQMPSQDPKRKEVLLVSQLQVEEKQTHINILEMKRDKKGKLRSLEPFSQIVEQAEVQSPLLNAFALGFLGLAQDKP